MNQYVKNRQIAFILFNSIVGYGVMNLPKNTAEKVGTGSWITLLISTAIVIAFTYLLIYLGYTHKNKTIYEYSELLVGKFITSIFMTIYIIYFFIIFSMITRLSCEVIKLSVLIKTPIWILCSLFLLVAYYALVNKLKIIARICEIYGFFIIIAYLIIFFLISTQGSLINVRPLLGSENIGTYFKAISVTTIPFLGIALLVTIPINKKTNNKKIFMYTASIIAFIGILYIFVVESCISVMGVAGIVYYKDSLLATIRRIDISWLQFLSRLDGLFLVAWIMAVSCTIITFAYGTTFLLSKYFKNIHFSVIAFIVMSLAFIMSLIPKTIDNASKILLYISYLGIFTIGVIPMILLIVTKIKKTTLKS
ncbi:GerAB/ArcD/ProY family transporter [Wukongibacter sp. M2B1]|uniref:GerAB/ArcD/ProY family transporter n=1 Tax=Wukongibacter sp. M2B1 TaxID=3088895 RepID=UPI003D7A613A